MGLLTRMMILLLVMWVPFFLCVTFCSSIVVVGSCGQRALLVFSDEHNDDHDRTRMIRIKRINTD